MKIRLGKKQRKLSRLIYKDLKREITDSVLKDMLEVVMGFAVASFIYDRFVEPKIGNKPKKNI